MPPRTRSAGVCPRYVCGITLGEVGRGTFVRVPQAQPADGPAADLRRQASGPIDLSWNLPLAGLAEPHVRRVLAEIGRGDGLPALLDYQTDVDLARQSEAALHWLSLCGLDAVPEEVTVTNGAQHGLLCTLMALLRPGDLLLVEALSYPPLRAMAERLGVKLAAVALDEAGPRPEALAAICESAAPKAFYLTPTLQTPTTTTLSPERREAIARLARRHDVLLIEDDVFGLLKPDRPAPLATLAPERTVYVTSVSKCLAPGLRVGYLRAPSTLAPALRYAVNLSTWMTPPLTSEVAAQLILDGTAARLIEAQRATAARRQQLARHFLKDRCFAADPTGLHLWLPLPDGWRGDLFRRAAEQRGVLVAEARTFALRPADGPEAVRLCLSHEPSQECVRDGLSMIDRLLDLPPTPATLLP